MLIVDGYLNARKRAIIPRLTRDDLMAETGKKNEMHNPFSQLIIFDCDGVLVDSEFFENQLLVDMSARHGVRLDVNEAHANFIVRNLTDCVGLM